MVLPTGILPCAAPPAIVSFEASRADLLRYGSVSCDLKMIRPRAMELLLTPSDVGRPAVNSGRWPGIARARVVPMRVWAKLYAPLGSPADGSIPRFTVSETVVLRSRVRVARQGKIGAGPWRYGFTDCGNPACCSPYPVALTPLGAKVWLAKNDPATGAAPVWACLQNRCLSCSAKPEKERGNSKQSGFYKLLTEICSILLSPCGIFLIVLPQSGP